MSGDSPGGMKKQRFEPYDKIQEPNADARAAGAALVREGVDGGRKKKTFIYVNNRLEGNALETIAAMIDANDLVEL